MENILLGPQEGNASNNVPEAGAAQEDVRLLQLLMQQLVAVVIEVTVALADASVGNVDVDELAPSLGYQPIGDTECEERVNDFGYGEELSTVGGELEAAACPSIQLKRKPDKCGHCSYTTANPQQLMQHFQTNHADQYPFVCDFCDFRCLERKTLNLHTRTEHAGEKRFSCEFCDYKAVRLIYLKRHVVVHSDEKRFSCEFCDFKTRYHSNLRTHLRNHTDEKPYRCELCEYSSRFLSNLKTHQRTHTGDKLFSCGHCDYKTSFSGNLKKHVKSHN
ncbi:zinc finger and SCAN domain-containing protein 2-like [Nilaparvata lugens]|uniref:zinc finger and SCAN domain-containing protein 2-like n=1 Tax=Nilaparvata lugens TaxID=108931 RepID=UPI00193C9DA4|nr:zinc finger and SCAN domain-containing protein 2-like [Nilaparvata lugens]